MSQAALKCFGTKLFWAFRSPVPSTAIELDANVHGSALNTETQSESTLTRTRREWILTHSQESHMDA